MDKMSFKSSEKKEKEERNLNESNFHFDFNLRFHDICQTPFDDEDRVE